MGQRLSDFLESTTPTTDEPTTMRMGDFMSADPVDVTSVEGGIYQTTAAQRKEWEADGTIGWWEQWGRQDKTEMIPFFGAAEGAVKSFSVLHSVSRYQEANYTDPDLEKSDLEKINKFLMRAEEERIRGYSNMGNIARGVAFLPGFMVEFMATGGAAAVGRAGVRSAVQPIIRTIAKSGALKFTTRVAGGAAGVQCRRESRKDMPSVRWRRIWS